LAAAAAKIDLARRGDAQRCAPRELATAEANLDFANAELSSGESGRASDHLREAEAAVNKALDMNKYCVPKSAEPLVVRIADGDRDGDGIPDSIDRCPDDPEDFDGFQDDDGCPDYDNDDDGVPDSVDRCPNTPGPASNAGCPILEPVADLDSDKDGVPDALDRCPNTPGPAENAGCPVEYKRVVVKQDRVEIKQQIRFKTGSARITGIESFETIKDIARALRDNAQIKRLRIEGHTDAVGSAASNMTLSQLRANAVKAQLVKNGVESGRLEAVGYGKTQPLASNATSAGRAKNRRTEFRIIEQ
jgi:outer membrane protein OmpA-like peptidoglycan-associated protein